MAGFRAFLKAGHTPTLFAAFFYLMFSFVIWVMNGAMAPLVTHTPQQYVKYRNEANRVGACPAFRNVRNDAMVRVLWMG